MEQYIDWMRSCWYISITGNPVASIPAGFTPEGPPVGIQLSHAFEQATHTARRVVHKIRST